MPWWGGPPPIPKVSSTIVVCYQLSLNLLSIIVISVVTIFHKLWSTYFIFTYLHWNTVLRIYLHLMYLNNIPYIVIMWSLKVQLKSPLSKYFENIFTVLIQFWEDIYSFNTFLRRYLQLMYLDNIPNIVIVWSLKVQL